MPLLIENKRKCSGDFLTGAPCMIYDSECSEDRGTICVIGSTITALF